MLEQRTDTRERLIDAAEAVITGLGASRATTREVARAAGVSEGTIYLHFANKDDLLAAVIRERLLMPVIAFTPPEMNGTAPRETLVPLLDEALRTLREKMPLLAAVMSDATLAGSIYADPPGDGRLTGLEQLTRYLEHEQRAGRVTSSTAPGMLARLLLAGIFHQAWLSRMFGEERLDVGSDVFTQRLVDAVLGTSS